MFQMDIFKMDTQEQFEYWLERAKYDLNAAQVMFDAEYWIYVSFICQQAIEKLVKGLYLIYNNYNIPYRHDI
jgi:HEPN domain-containing protein